MEMQLVGQKIKKPLHIKFALRDSVMEMREVSNFARRPIFSTSKDESIKQAMKKGVGEPVMEGFKVMAYNADSTAVVFDMTDFLVSDNKRRLFLTLMVRRQCLVLVCAGQLSKKSSLMSIR